ncbi:MAG: hypothetical protein ACQKBV_10260 [Puniceicoccales bacterium]
MNDAFDRLKTQLGDRIDRLDLNAKGVSMTYLEAFDDLLKRYLPKSYKSKRMRINRFVELTANNPALKSDEDLTKWISMISYGNWPLESKGQNGDAALVFLERLSSHRISNVRRQAERKGRVGRRHGQDGKFLKKNKDLPLQPAKKKISEAHKRICPQKRKFNPRISGKK